MKQTLYDSTSDKMTNASRTKERTTNEESAYFRDMLDDIDGSRMSSSALVRRPWGYEHSNSLFTKHGHHGLPKNIVTCCHFFGRVPPVCSGQRPNKLDLVWGELVTRVPSVCWYSWAFACHWWIQRYHELDLVPCSRWERNESLRLLEVCGERLRLRQKCLPDRPYWSLRCALNVPLQSNSMRQRESVETGEIRILHGIHSQRRFGHICGEMCRLCRHWFLGDNRMFAWWHERQSYGLHQPYVWAIKSRLLSWHSREWGRDTGRLYYCKGDAEDFVRRVQRREPPGCMQQSVINCITKGRCRSAVVHRKVTIDPYPFYFTSTERA